ncbi:LOW QUALITY PROTEIN: hypothetical protein PoB_000860700 [Plakobranchus ocellatus]|uniref:Uncharacterized protein n=1 Tax=Plakobranchus ocellatus TaxID=259542 RepID=A0AAV3YIT6_9GAST|nr:LOW QUALITY PROTEIN: hypothetical protein PoB_000860700 [Plakobranchus ocellatus]
MQPLLGTGLKSLRIPEKVEGSGGTRQDRPPFKPPQERREVTPPGRSWEAERHQPELKNLLESMMAGAETRSEEQRGEDKYETGRASWGSRSCPTGHPKDSPPQEVLNPNSLVPPRQPQKVINPRGLDPPDQQKLKEKLDLVASEGTWDCNIRRSHQGSTGAAKFKKPPRREISCLVGIDAVSYRVDNAGIQEAPYDERSRAFGVRGSPVRGDPRRPREMSREGENRGGRWQRPRGPRERSREGEDMHRGQRQCSRSPRERSRESGDREPSPDIEKSGVSQR